jgi:hypothetical protein
MPSEILLVKVCSTWSVPSYNYVNKGLPVRAWSSKAWPWRTLQVVKIAEFLNFFLVIPGGNLSSITRKTVKNIDELFKKHNARLALWPWKSIMLASPYALRKSLSAFYSYVRLRPATLNKTVEVFTAHLIDLGNTVEGGFFSRKIYRVVSQKEILSYHSSCNAIVKSLKECPQGCCSWKPYPVQWPDLGQYWWSPLPTHTWLFFKSAVEFHQIHHSQCIWS